MLPSAARKPERRTEREEEKNHAQETHVVRLRIVLTREDLHFIAPYIILRARARGKRGPNVHADTCTGKRVTNARYTEDGIIRQK